MFILIINYKHYTDSLVRIKHFNDYKNENNSQRPKRSLDVKHIHGFNLNKTTIFTFINYAYVLSLKFSNAQLLKKYNSNVVKNKKDTFNT